MTDPRSTEKVHRWYGNTWGSSAVSIKVFGYQPCEGSPVFRYVLRCANPQNNQWPWLLFAAVRCWRLLSMLEGINMLDLQSLVNFSLNHCFQPHRHQRHAPVKCRWSSSIWRPPVLLCFTCSIPAQLACSRRPTTEQ